MHGFAAFCAPCHFVYSSRARGEAAEWARSIFRLAEVGRRRRHTHLTRLSQARWLAFWPRISSNEATVTKPKLAACSVLLPGAPSLSLFSEQAGGSQWGSSSLIYKNKKKTFLALKHLQTSFRSSQRTEVCSWNSYCSHIVSTYIYIALWKTPKVLNSRAGVPITITNVGYISPTWVMHVSHYKSECSPSAGGGE